MFFFFFQAEDGIRDAQESRGLGDVYKRQPHHSWREMHQSLMLVIQCMNVLVSCSGTNLVLPCSTAAAAFSASGAALTHHCSISIGSITAPLRWLRPRGTRYGL